MNFPTVFAHEGEEVMEMAPSLGETIRANSIQFSLIAVALLVILLILSHFFKEKNEILKKLLFWSIILVIVANTLYLSLATIYLNIKSITGGPVHYHADFEVWNCGQEIMLKKPEGLSNKTGTELTHVHNDKRLHVEGVIQDSHELTLGHIFESLGGELNDQTLTLPTDQGTLTLKDGDTCPNGDKANLQVFVYQTKNNNFTQKKLTDFKDYQISPYTQVPPGDCVILEFGSLKERTDKLCQSYQVAKQTGKIHGH